MSRIHSSTLVGVSALLTGCTWIHPTEPVRNPPEGLAQPRFETVGVDFAHRWDQHAAHHLSGAAVLDFDGDGRDEIFLGGGEGQPDALLSLSGDRLVDRIGGTNLSSLSASYGAAALDFDDDGDVDLFVARNEGVTFHRNEGGDPPFFSRHPVAIDLPEHSVPLAVSIGDVDRDGDGDLYVSVFVDRPHFVTATFNVPSHAKANRLLRNDGELRFTDVTDPVTETRQNTFTSLFVDLDGDGWQDLVVAQNTGQVEILRNRADGLARFEAIESPSGFGFWMGVAAGDVDGDGDQDLVLTNVGDSFPGFLVRGDRREDQPYAPGWLLLRNDGGFRFTDVTRQAGLGGLGFAWGPAFEDVNLDGRLDLLVAQNYVKWPVHHLFKFPGKLLLGASPGPDFYASDAAADPAFGNAPVIADFDGDGRPDVFWVNSDGPSRAYLNRSEGNAVVAILPDTVGALGARVRLEGEAPGFTREVGSGGGLGTDSAPRLTFGLGQDTRAGRLVVDWADGNRTVVENPPTNQPLHLSPALTPRS